MVRMLIAGFAALVLGLNLMAIWYSLTITTESPEEVLNKLLLVGGVITLVGFAILIVGIIPSFLKKVSQERAAILSTGSNMVALGIAWIIGMIGYGKESIVKAGAWAATVIGVALVIAYCVVRIKNNYKSKIANPN